MMGTVMRITALFGAGSAIGLGSADAVVAQCTYEVDREVTVSASGVNALTIRAGSGGLHVEGQAGLEEIVVVGMVCASHEEYLDDLDVSVEQLRRGEVTLVAHYPRQSSRSGRSTARIDLTVLVPLGLDVDIDDSSGDIVVSGTGSLNIDDSSGSIDVSRVAGTLTIDDSSGDLDVRDISGDVDIEDGSGRLRVEDVEGAVVIRDGSGGIDIARVAEDVLIESDGSGGIDVRDIGGDFSVDRDGSGGIRHSGVEGRVEIPQRRRRGN